MYPLGYNLWPSFGFGVLFATEFNVSNNAPLVIWAETSNWYPLLPSRVNNKNDIVDLTDMYDYDEVYSKSDQYNMCPNCGNLFGLDGPEEMDSALNARGSNSNYNVCEF